MKKEKRLLRICMILIGLTIVSCVGFSYLTRLKEPVFMTYCVAVCAVPSASTGYDQPILELQYLTNRDDTKEVMSISFQEAPEYLFTATENPHFGNSFTFFSNNETQQRGEALGRYSLRTVYLYMDNYFIGDWQGEVELNNALISFNDGSTYKVNLGRVLIYSDVSEVPAMDITHSSSSNQGNSNTSYFVRQKLSNLKLEMPNIEEFDSVMELTINSLPYDELDDLELKRGDTLLIENHFKESNNEGSYDVYDVRPKLTYTREDGTRGFTRIYDIKYRHYFYSYMDALQYLMRMGGF